MESTILADRATIDESTMNSERANHHDSIEHKERAAIDESTMNSEQPRKMRAP
jgi:hypothetical protein